MSNSFDEPRFREFPVVGILRGFASDEVAGLLPAALEGGLCNIEITMNSRQAAKLIIEAKRQVGERMNVGAGTVCDLQQLDAALDAGAQFIVTPVLVPEVIAACADRNVPVFPGAMTPSEIHRAWQLGAAMVKVFPADQFGPAYIKAVKAPLADIRLMPTGGVTVENLPDYLRAGAEGFGIGSPLFHKDRVASCDWDWVRQQVVRFRQAYESAAGRA